MDRTAIIDGYPYRLQMTGEGAPVWVFLHGFMGSAGDFEQVEPMGTRIMVDLLGFGPHAPVVAEAERFSVTNQVDDLAAIMEALDVAPVNLVGYSMGARLALSVAVTYPQLINRLFLESGTAGLADEAERVARQRADNEKADRIAREGMDSFVADWEQLPLFASQQQLPAQRRAFMHEQRVNQQPQNIANSLRYFGTGAMPSYWDQLATLPLPVTLITGEQDTKFKAINERMYALLAKPEHIEVADVGHNVHFEAPEIMTEILNDYADKTN